MRVRGGGDRIGMTSYECARLFIYTKIVDDMLPIRNISLTVVL